jgi:lysophospholipase L1-like esterase
VLYCPLLQAAHPEWDVICKGESGELTPDGNDRLTADLNAAAAPPQVVVIEEGVNDCVVGSGYYDVSSGSIVCDTSYPLEAHANLEAMANAVRAHGGTPLITTTLYNCPIFGFGCMWLPVDHPGFCPEIRCLFDDACMLSQLVRNGTTPWVSFVLGSGQFADLLHPNEAGNAILAERAADAITAALSTTTTTIP